MKKGSWRNPKEESSASDSGSFSLLELTCACRWSSFQSRFLPWRPACPITVVLSPWLDSNCLEAGTQRCEDAGLGIWIPFLECSSLPSKRKTKYDFWSRSWRWALEVFEIFWAVECLWFFFIHIQFRLVRWLGVRLLVWFQDWSCQPYPLI